MTAILGLSAFYHDAAAALVVDGEIVAAAQEERFTRVKHDPRMPVRAIEYCLGEAGLTVDQLDFVGFYEKPLLKFDRLLESYLASAPRGFRSFLQAMPVWLKEKLHHPSAFRKALGKGYRRRFVFAEHHESHAASAFFPSPYDEAAFLTLDGVGEWATASFGVGRGNQIELLGEQRFPHSLGLLYSAFTYYCGFKVNSGEYKLMGLAPYGRPVFADLILEELIDLKPDGSLRLDLDYFDFVAGRRMTSKRFDRLFGGPARPPESPLDQRQMDLAASIQAVTEEAMLRSARHVHERTGQRNLCLAGGVALNCVGNGRLLREGPFESIWVQPAAGDSGGALGVALLIWHQLLGRPRTARPGDAQRGSLLGPAFSESEIRGVVGPAGAAAESFDDDEALCRHVAGLLAEGKVVGWFQGRMEFGPRALGARSILGDPRDPNMQGLMNRKIKFRESFRPFAPAVLAHRADECFQLGPGVESPYMLLVAPIAERRSIPPSAEEAALAGIDRLKARRSDLPAVTHVDGSARIQTVDAARNPRFHQLLRAFDRLTGCPVLINTSFNVRGEPIVRTPREAYRCFLATDIDALVLERTVVSKSEAGTGLATDRAAYLAAFPLD